MLMGINMMVIGVITRYKAWGILLTPMDHRMMESG